jgi:hypothetical protein
MTAGQERRHPHVVPRQAPTAPASALGIPQVVSADDRGVLERLVCGEVRDETAVAMGGGVTIHHEHASGRAGVEHDLASAAVRVGVVAEQATLHA